MTRDSLAPWGMVAPAVGSGEARPPLPLHLPRPGEQGMLFLVPIGVDVKACAECGRRCPDSGLWGPGRWSDHWLCGRHGDELWRLWLWRRRHEKKRRAQIDAWMRGGMAAIAAMGSDETDKSDPIPGVQLQLLGE